MIRILELYFKLVEQNMPIEFDYQTKGNPSLKCFELSCLKCPYISDNAYCSDSRKTDYPILHDYLLINNPELLI